jgi:hypothetical protein
MLQRAVAFALTLATAGVWSLPEAAGAQSTQALSPWQRTDSQHFEIHYLPAVTPELGRVVQSAERAYDRISGQLNLVFSTKVPLVMFTPSGPMTRNEIRAYSGSAQVAPLSPHRSRIDLPVPEGDAQLDALIVHELTHVLVSRLICGDRIGDGGLPHWVKEGIASYMVGVWRDEDERLMRELIASHEVPALSHLNGNGGFTNARVNDALGHAAFDYIGTPMKNRFYLAGWPSPSSRMTLLAFGSGYARVGTRNAPQVAVKAIGSRSVSATPCRALSDMRWAKTMYGR